MAQSPLLGSLAKAIGKGMKGLFYPGVYEVDGAPTGSAYDPVAGAVAQYPCLIIEGAFSAYELQGGLVRGTDRMVMVLATSLAVTPVEGGRITSRGVILTIYNEGGAGRAAVTTDPARAVWTLRCRT